MGTKMKIIKTISIIVQGIFIVAVMSYAIIGFIFGE